jgi:Tetratricopeptide repeat
MGRVAGAVAEFDRLLTAQQRVLGADHPDTLTTRNNLAFCRWEGGMSRMICPRDEGTTGTADYGVSVGNHHRTAHRSP